MPDSLATHIPLHEILLRFLMAAGFGAAIGLDREFKNRPAGLRTHMLTALASAVFTVLALELFHQVRQLEDNPAADPIRIIEAVTAGVAFLAAGTIIRGDNEVHGLTTGAGMWLAGSIGVACGGGYYSVAVIAVVPAVVILALLRRFSRQLSNGEKIIPGKNNRKK